MLVTHEDEGLPAPVLVVEAEVEPGLLLPPEPCDLSSAFVWWSLLSARNTANDASSFCSSNL